jgi:hypothetical protein
MWLDLGFLWKVEAVFETFQAKLSLAVRPRMKAAPSAFA